VFASTVPRKTHPDVAGEVPAAAMPIPYTNSCGQGCHNAALLPFLKPGRAFGAEEDAWQAQEQSPVRQRAGPGGLERAGGSPR
jgi:hypothetical protein